MDYNLAMRWWLVLVLATGGVSGSNPAEACSCDGSPEVFPRSGSVDVPVNARVVVHQAFSFGQEDVRLVRAADASAVPVTVTQTTRGGGSERLSVATPVRDLEPLTEYQVVMDTYGVGSLATFITGTGRDTVPPAYAGIEGLRLESMSIGDLGYDSSCTESTDGWHGRIRPAFGELPADIAFLQLELYRPSDTDIPVDTISSAGPTKIESTTCALRPPALEPGAGWCARAVAYDLAGNAGGRERVACSDVVECARMYDDGYAGEPCHQSSGGCAAGDLGGSGPGLVALLLLIALRRRARSNPNHGPGM